METLKLNSRPIRRVGCKRLFDYFLIVSCSSTAKETIIRRLKSQKSIGDKNDEYPAFVPFTMVPKIVDRYPTKDHQDCALLEWIVKAAAPRGIRARTKPPAPKYFSFIGFNSDGTKLYGACLEIYEYVDISNQILPVYIPQILVLISHHPYFYAHEVLLQCLWYTVPKKSILIEDLLLHFFYDIPAVPVAKKVMCLLSK